MPKTFYLETPRKESEKEGEDSEKRVPEPFGAGGLGLLLTSRFRASTETVPFLCMPHAYGCRSEEGAIGDGEGRGQSQAQGRRGCPDTPSHQMGSGLQFIDIETI